MPDPAQNNAGSDARKPRMLVLSQVYVPDAASVGQHMADAAAEMVERGWDVRVLTSARGYNDSSVKYKKRETISGVEVRRLPLSSFGKRGLLLRALAAVLFMVQITARGLFGRRPDVLLVSTSPPMCIVAALVISTFRRTRVKFWVMDLNPDQLISLGKIKEGSVPARLMDAFNRMILRRSDDVVVLDKYMAGNVNAKLDVSGKLAVMPPWPHEDHVQPLDHADNTFRDEHGLQSKRVFMYSGNHGYALPLETFLKAAVRYKDDERVAFLFIGAGVRKAEVEQAIADHALTNMVSLPYQPLERLRFSLSAADVHLVSMGDEAVGTIHPCKVYGAMAVSRPVLLLGPDPCHIADLIHEHQFGWHVRHGDVDAAASVIDEVISLPDQALQEMGARAAQAIRSSLSKDALCGRFCDVLERGTASERSPRPELSVAEP